ncbi:hypothetical protein M3B92_10465 [Brevibacterium casei]|uniref:hypothetical protein n=1 Tax=Brevibacterium casei TaxID=33889 RepID=UPI00223C2942|nr:hypothetical protein [Brevibacterium casei]MCT1766536.1 hypothetical protein [Brevibacterium casei]
MTDTPTPGNRPTPGAPTPGNQPTPGAPTPGNTPTPGSVNKEVPAEAWKRGLAETAEAPAAERHTALSALLDDLETQVGSL